MPNYYFIYWYSIQNVVEIDIYQGFENVTHKETPILNVHSGFIRVQVSSETAVFILRTWSWNDYVSEWFREPTEPTYFSIIFNINSLALLSTVITSHEILKLKLKKLSCFLLFSTFPVPPWPNHLALSGKATHYTPVIVLCSPVS